MSEKANLGDIDQESTFAGIKYILCGFSYRNLFTAKQLAESADKWNSEKADDADLEEEERKATNAGLARFLSEYFLDDPKSLREVIGLWIDSNGYFKMEASKDVREMPAEYVHALSFIERFLTQTKHD